MGKRPTKGSAAAMRPDLMILTTTNQVLPVALTDAEWVETAETAAALGADIQRLEAEKKAAMKAFNEQINDLKADWSEMNQNAHTRTAPRSVDVGIYADLSANERVIVRLDTHEVVKRVPLTTDERERALQLPLIGDASQYERAQ